MPYIDSESNKLYQKQYYENNKDILAKQRRERYISRDDLILENIKLKDQIRELNNKLLASVEGKKFVKKLEEVPEIIIQKGSFNLSFE